jgi:DNA repair protein RadA
MEVEIRLVSHDFVSSNIDINCGKSYETNPKTENKSIDDKPRESFNSIFRTATELNQQNIPRLPTGCKSLDNLLDGGIEAGVITQIYGPAGSGKTQLCYTLCVMLPSDYRAIYIDTEGSFRPERIKAIAKARSLEPKQILQKILVTKALDCNAQESCIEAACSKCETNNNKIKLLIVDSLIYHYRAEYAGRSKTPERIQRLNKSMHTLLKTASSNAVAVVVTNHQTQSSVNGFHNSVVPLGGNVMSYASKYRIHLDARYHDRRRAKLDLSPSHPPSGISFAIDERGFTDTG